MKARRDLLANICVQETTHAGLWLDKFLEHQTEEDGKDKEAIGKKAQLIQEVSTIEVPAGYQEAHKRREKLFSELKAAKQAECCTATVEGRMIIGLGQKGPVEAGLALEHTWGVPIIPGSALKGLTMAAAHLLLEDEEWRKKADGRGSSLALLGGTLEHIGKVIFHDAWWIPAEGETLPIHLDVMTVHHPDYYKDGTKSPSDMDSPVPIPFASVTGKFLVVVELSDPNSDEADKLLDAALFILQQGLAHLGIGAKTNAGYGRMKLDYQSQAEQQKKHELQQQKLLNECCSLIDRLKINQADTILKNLERLSGENRKIYADKVIKHLTEKSVAAKRAEGKAWARILLEAVQ